MDESAAQRVTVFCAVFALVAVAELLWPRRPLTASKKRRWFCNISMILIDTVAARLFLPLLPVGMAGLASDKGWGILNQLSWTGWLGAILAILILDLIIYLQHRAFHRVQFFWRFHRMHHTDLDLDVTSGHRFHPMEILFSLVVKIAAVALIGAPVAAVLIFEMILNASSLFNHGNMRIPLVIDVWLRLFIVTPDMHRVHHSVYPRETDSNFGFNVPWWDRWFKTYHDQPRDGHLNMAIGLKEFRDEQKLCLMDLLLLPFRRQNG
jgi:sterol desaturase/sphingolipid hydroxylase (fatty acid hydroxylase superfamily)